MLKSCPRCGRVHDTRYPCSAARKPWKHDTEESRLRNAAAWRKASKAARERDGGLCQMCLAEHTLTYDGLEVHHIQPLSERPDLAYDIDNLVTLCRRHHEIAEREGYPRRV